MNKSFDGLRPAFNDMAAKSNTFQDVLRYYEAS